MLGTIYIISIQEEHTTAKYFKSAIEKIGLICVYLNSAPDYDFLQESDILFYIDPISDFVIGFENARCITVVYFIDTHLHLESRLKMAPFFDLVLLSQNKCIKKFYEIGCPNVYWMPLACDPIIHDQESQEKEFQVSFVGSLGPLDSWRNKTLRFVLGQYKTNNFYKFYSPIEMSRIYGKSKIVFNASIGREMNMRFFEALSSGALLVTDRIPDAVRNLFEENIHYVGYDTPEEAVEKINYFLKNENEMIQISSAGKSEVLKNHTYSNRLDEILRLVCTTPKQAPVRGYSKRALAESYSAVFSQLRDPLRIVKVVSLYGLSVKVFSNLIKASLRWINVRMPISLNAFKRRLSRR